MTAEGGEWVIINYDYQQVVKLYPECKRLATLFVNYRDCCIIKVRTTNGIPSYLDLQLIETSSKFVVGNTHEIKDGKKITHIGINLSL